ncbi:FIG01045170: hypothetical protein [Klebsiella pneumoniae IS43]|uniref:YlcG family protein n=1 Tax=Klebsiella pneumoniae IS43 TaxID=1432552 RepID=W1DTF1_KLEPN|nr:FIG01045170: hypothetical protein [Klebsiella pneumoniae IS43]
MTLSNASANAGKKLRLCRHRGTVLVDYRILRNFVRIYQTLGETA